MEDPPRSPQCFLSVFLLLCFSMFYRYSSSQRFSTHDFQCFLSMPFFPPDTPLCGPGALTRVGGCCRTSCIAWKPFHIIQDVMQELLAVLQRSGPCVPHTELPEDGLHFVVVRAPEGCQRQAVVRPSLAGNRPNINAFRSDPPLTSPAQVSARAVRPQCSPKNSSRRGWPCRIAQSGGSG